MSPKTAHDLVIVPTLRWAGYDSKEARVLLVAIGCTESGNFRFRLQIDGPARGLWQFEKNGGCAEVEQAPRLSGFRFKIREMGFNTQRDVMYRRIGDGADQLACLMARAILWLEPAPLPAIGDVDEAYRQYRARWRPGKPSRSRFDMSYATALTVVP